MLHGSPAQRRAGLVVRNNACLKLCSGWIGQHLHLFGFIQP